MYTIILLWGKLKHCRTLGQLGGKKTLLSMSRLSLEIFDTFLSGRIVL